MAIDAAVLARVREQCAVIPSLAQQIEESRKLPPQAVKALTDSGVFKLLVPRAYGGGEASVGTFLAVLQEVARLDGSAGWAAMIGASTGLVAGYLEPATAKELYGSPEAVSSGVVAPMGRAVPVEGGYRVTGRWPFSSGCEHSQWRLGGAVVMAEKGPLIGPTGLPVMRQFLFSADQSRVLDTWHVSGLRGTGSHDLVVEDAFVPTARSISLGAEPPHADGPLFRLSLLGLLASGIAAVALGIARASVETLVKLATEKKPLGSPKTIAHRELVQLAVAQAEVKLRAGQALLVSALEQAEASALTQAPSLQERALIRMASVHATREAAAAVDLMYDAGGGSSVYASSLLQRQFRDVHVATQHAMVSPQLGTDVGKILLGVETDTSRL